MVRVRGHIRRISRYSRVRVKTHSRRRPTKRWSLPKIKRRRWWY